MDRVCSKADAIVPFKQVEVDSRRMMIGTCLHPAGIATDNIVVIDREVVSVHTTGDGFAGGHSRAICSKILFSTNRSDDMSVSIP